MFHAARSRRPFSIAAAAVLLLALLTTLGTSPAAAETKASDASIGGSVTFQEGTGAEGIVADLFEAKTPWDRAQYLRSVETDGSGNYSFDGLEADCYIVVIIAPDNSSFGLGSKWSQQYSCVDPDQADTSISATLVGTAPEDDDSDDTDDSDDADDSDSDDGEPFDLNILHINDHHSHLQPDTGDLDFDGVSTRVELGGFPRVVAKIAEREAALGTDSVVKIHAGDAITGTLFYTLFEGEADAAMMNQACFDIFALGNHEFDRGDAGLAKFLNFLDKGPCDTEVLAANVKPALGTPLAPESQTDFFKPSTIRTIDGNKVGFVGIDIKNKTELSSSPLDTTEFLDELETAQATIDELAKDGIENIVLVTHVQYENDLELAAGLTGVDVIVGGDSHTLQGDFDQYGLPATASYPTEATNADGTPVCVVHAWQYSWLVGELNVTFDGNGGVSSCGGTPHLLLGDTFLRRPAPEEDRAPLEGDALDDVLKVIEGDPALSVVTPNPGTESLLAEFASEVDVLAAEEIGTATEDFCLERIPGQGRSVICDVADTAQNGGDIQQFVTEAFRQRAFESDIAIQNSGGVRIDIPAGPVTIADAYELLPFANTLVYLDMTGEEIEATINEGVNFAQADGGSTGAYPYAAGLRWDADLSQPEGSRITNLEVKPRDSDTWVPLDRTATYRVVSNSFVASGGDSYATMEAVSEDGRATDSFLDYAQSFVDYIQQDLDGNMSKVPADEYSTQSFVPAPAD